MKSSSVAMTATVLLIMVGLFHHPVVGHHGDPQQLYMQIAQLGFKDQVVHGALIAMLAALAASLATLDRRLGQARGAYASYGLGCMLLGVAMLLDGFVVPRMASQLMPDAQAGMPVLLATGAVIQVFSKAGLIAHSVAMLAWSWTARGKAPWLAAIGILPAVAAAVMLFSDVQLTPHTLLMIFAAHAAWYLTAAWTKGAD